MIRKLLDYLSLRLMRSGAIHHRLIGAFFLLSLLPLLITGLIAYVDASKNIEDKTRLLASEIVKQIAQNIRLQMTQLEASTEEFVLSDRLQATLGKYYGDDESGRVTSRTEMTKALLEKFGSFDYINEKYFLDDDNEIMDSQVFAQLGKGISRLVMKTPDQRDRPFWNTYQLSSERKSLVLLRPVNLKSNNRWGGTLFLGLKPAYFARIFAHADLGKDAQIFILDSDSGNIVAQAGEAAPAANGHKVDPGLIDGISNSRYHGSQSAFVAYEDKNNQNYVAVYTPIANSSWLVVSSFPASNLTLETRALRNKLILISWSVFILALLCAMLIARSIAIPLQQLIEAMKQSENDEQLIPIRRAGNDEITALAQQFNNMADKIRQHKLLLEARVDERTRALQNANDKLEALSTTDSLTGLANRRRFDEALANEWLRAMRSGQAITLLMLDVDWFKKYNDHYGHQAGDKCLREIAKVMQANAKRAGDLAARYGGEEFAFIAAEMDIGHALPLAETIRSAVEKLALPHIETAPGCVTVSIGVATLVPEESHTPQTLVQLADEALYRAKNKGRNRVEVANGKQ